MSFVQQSDVYRNLQKADRKHHGYSFILVLFCMALGIVVASAIFARYPSVRESTRIRGLWDHKAPLSAR
jgi:hypothetical protein